MLKLMLKALVNAIILLKIAPFKNLLAKTTETGLSNLSHLNRNLNVGLFIDFSCWFNAICISDVLKL